MISDILPVNNYTGNDSSTTFDFDFYIENTGQLKVYLINSSGISTLLTKNVDYSVTPYGSDYTEGGYITYPKSGSSHSILSSEEKISLRLDIPFSQESEYKNSSLLNLTNLENSLDYLTRLTQILKRELQRAAKVPEGSDVTVDDLSMNLVAVGENIDSVNAVSADLANIDTVVGGLSDINTVAESINNVNSVADDLTNINAVKNDLANIDTVVGGLSDINTVANSIGNVNTVAGSIDNVDTIAGVISNINDVANDLTNINDVANDLENIDSASSNANLAKDWANKTNGPVDGAEFSAKYYAQQAAQSQVQANWNETDNTSKSFIQNKPDLTVYFKKSNIATSWSNSPSDTKCASEKLVYDTIGDLESLLNTINSGGNA